MINIICKEKKEMESINVSKRNVNRVSNLLFDRLVMGEKEKVLMILMSMFGRLCYEDLEEVYMDGCMVLWNRWKENKVHLQDEGIVKFLIKICKNIGMHYLRGVRDDVLSLDVLMEDRVEKDSGEECFNIGDMFDVMDGGMNENDDNEMMERLKNVWEKLSDVDKIILVSYYWDGLKMEEIVKRVGYKSVDSVKSKKSKCLKRMLEMMKKEKAADQLPSLRSVPIREKHFFLCVLITHSTSYLMSTDARFASSMSGVHFMSLSMNPHTPSFLKRTNDTPLPVSILSYSAGT